MSGLLVALLLVTSGQTTSTSLPYVRTRADKSDALSACLYWDVPTLTFHQANGGATDAMYQAVSTSWQTWQAEFARCGNLDIQEGARLDLRKVGFDPKSNDNVNLVIFRTKSCDTPGVKTGSCARGECGNMFDCWEWGGSTIALTTSSYSKSTGRVFDSDVEMNAANFDFTTADAPVCQQSLTGCVCADRTNNCVITDVENTMTHEVGHVVGLDHDGAKDSTMYFEAPPGETSKRTLDFGSKQFICDVYPKGKASQACVVKPVADELGTVAQGCSAGAGAGGGLALAALLRLLVRRRRG